MNNASAAAAAAVAAAAANASPHWQQQLLKAEVRTHYAVVDALF